MDPTRPSRDPGETRGLTVVVALLCAFFLVASVGGAEQYDLLFRNGRVIDGTGAPWYRADVAVSGDTIVAVGPGLDGEASRTVDLVVGLVEEGPDHRYHNAAAYFSRGRLAHVHRKLYLPTYGMFLEGRDFAPGQSLRTFETPHGPRGMLVCEDHWHATCPWLLAQQGAEAIFTLSSSPSRGARPELEVTSVREDKPITGLATTITNQDGDIVLEGTALTWTEPVLEA